MSYVLVLLTLVVCIAFSMLVARLVGREEAAGLPRGVAFRPVAAPRGFFLDRGHTWVGIDPSGLARVGVDDFIGMAFGRVDAVELPKTGDEVNRGDKLFSIRQGKRAAAVVAPVGGVVTSVNDSLAERADLSEPYGQEWICLLKPSHLARDLRHLLIGEESESWLKREVQRLRALFAARPLKSLELGELSQDGGQPTAGLLEKVDEETWDLFVAQFLKGRSR